LSHRHGGAELPLGKPQRQIIGNQTWITLETVQCGSARIVIWVNPNDPANN
jgi:hypothetical protein